MYKVYIVLEKIIEKNRSLIENKQAFRKYNNELKTIVEILNRKKIVICNGLKGVGKTAFLGVFLKRTKSLQNYFYFNHKTDTLGAIKNYDDLVLLLDVYIRIYGVPKIIVLQNVHGIEDIKKFILTLHETKKYKIILVGNNIAASGIEEVRFYPISLQEVPHDYRYGGIPEVLLPNNTSYKLRLLEAFNKDILLSDILESYSIKNIGLFQKVIAYLAENSEYTSLREIHRQLEYHGIEIALLTLIDYVNAALNTKLLIDIQMYDIKQDKDIGTQVQYYFGDTGIRSIYSDNSHLLFTNTVCIELLIRGYTVYGGKNGRYEFSFYARTKNDEDVYIDIYTSKTEDSIEKIAKNLIKIGKKGRKIIITHPDSFTRQDRYEEVEILSLEMFVESI